MPLCCCSVTQSCLFWDTMDCRPPGSSVHGIFQVRILEWVAISGDLLWIGKWFFTTEPPGKLLCLYRFMHSAHFIEIRDLFFFFFQLGGMWDLSSPSRDQTHASCIGSAVLTSGPPGKSQCVVFWVWFLSLSVLFLRLIHFIICIDSSLDYV